MTYTTLVWTDLLGVDHVERFATPSAALTRAEELEALGMQVAL